MARSAKAILGVGRPGKAAVREWCGDAQRANKHQTNSAAARDFISPMRSDDKIILPKNELASAFA